VIACSGSAPFIFLGTLRPLGSITQGDDAARVNTLLDEILHCGFGPLLPEIHVEFIFRIRGTPIVAVPLDQYEVAWVSAQPRCVRVQDFYIARPDRRRAEVEVNVP